MHVCFAYMYVCVLFMPGDQKRAPDALELELQTAVSCHLGHVSGSSGKAGSLLLLIDYCTGHYGNI